MPSNHPPERSAKHRAIHLGWAALAILACVALALVPQRGHPPPIVLIPLVLILWPVGHAVIWVLGWLYRKGRSSARPAGAPADRWPLALLACLLGTAVAAIAGLLQLLGTALQQRWYPYPDPALWMASLVVCLAHAACLAGLLLRKPWSRILGAMLAAGWAALLGAQLVEHATPPARLATADGLLAMGLLALCLALAVNLIASRSVKSFFER